MSLKSLTLAAALAAFAAAPAAAAPDVAPPEDFGRAGQVRAALKDMHGHVRTRMKEAGHWRARRAEGICGDALRRLEDRITSNAYEPGVGEKIWRDCHRAYVEVE